MQLLALTSILLLLGGSASAKPSTDACCCCDVSKGVISCDASISAAECICPAVVCPPKAPTVWVMEQCCCCNIAIPATVCQLKRKGDCFCAEVMCPPDAPTTYIGPTATPKA